MLNIFVKRTYFLLARFFMLLVICCSCVARQAHAAQSAQSAEQVISDFIAGEFELAQDKRAQHCAFKQGGNLKLGSEFTPDSENPVVYIFPEGDNLVVVKTYKISTVTVRANHAEAVVSFDAVFTSKAVSRTFEKSIRNETVTYHLFMINNDWKIIDPPLPRVSYAGLTSFLLKQIDISQKIVDSGKASNAQKNTLNRQKNNYSILKSI